MSRSRISNSAGLGHLIVISGPSGTGKGTIVGELLKRRRAKLSVSCTTRAPRPHEIDGKAYFFITPEEFERREEDGDFLESANVFGNRYGTPRKEVLKELEKGNDVILEIDVQGAKQVKSRFPEARLIFIEPPSMEVLSERLRGRGTESSEQLALRTAKAKEELSHASEYDLCVVNDDLEEAIEQIEEYLNGLSSRTTTTGG